MRKILMRAGMSPLEYHTIPEILVENKVWNNIGNMLFFHSVARTIMTEDTSITPIRVEQVFTKKEINKMNQEYDCLVMPFANAFRASYISELRNVTKLVKSLSIPCVVVGVGTQQHLDEDKKNPELDIAVKNFMNAVLEKSSIVGVRGRTTAAYLASLGFVEEKDFTVIGCPSLYLYGKALPKPRLTDIGEQSAISFNSKIQLPQKFHNFMHNAMVSHPNYHYVPQVIEEINRMYAGMSYPQKFCRKYPKYYPVTFKNKIYASGKGITFLDVPSWLSYLKEKDFSIGSRIHGNIAAILAGTPCFVVVSDKRVLELVEYHNIPHILMQDLKEDMTIEQLYREADYDALHRGHEQRFMHYLDFLKKNQVENIYDENGEPGNVPFDSALKEIPVHGPIVSFSTLNEEEKCLRLEEYLSYFRDSYFTLRVENKKLKQQLVEPKQVSMYRKVGRKAKKIVKKLIK